MHGRGSHREVIQEHYSNRLFLYTCTRSEISHQRQDPTRKQAPGATQMKLQHLTLSCALSLHLIASVACAQEVLGYRRISASGPSIQVVTFVWNQQRLCTCSIIDHVWRSYDI